MTFDPTKPVQTRDGRKARILCTDRQGDHFPIVALVHFDDLDNEQIFLYTSEGRWNYHQTVAGKHDLINVPERHVHADLIIAWANGAKIQYFGQKQWVDTLYPCWSLDTKYRIKP